MIIFLRFLYWYAIQGNSLKVILLKILMFIDKNRFKIGKKLLHNKGGNSLKVIYWGIFLVILSFEAGANTDVVIDDTANVNNEQENVDKDRPQEDLLVVQLNKERDVLHKLIGSKIQYPKGYLPGTSGISILNETIFVLGLVSNKKIIPNTKTIQIIKTVTKILRLLKQINHVNENHLKWHASLDDIDNSILLPNIGISSDAYFSKGNHTKKDMVKLLCNSIKTVLHKSEHFLVEDLIKSYDDIAHINSVHTKVPSNFKKLMLNLNINFLVAMILSRGILNPNCKWFAINDLILKDKSGVDIYNNIKKAYDRPITPINILNKKIYLVNDVNFIQQILNQSPYVFGVGIYKRLIFKSFMSKNVGISEGKPWYNRRRLNNRVLCFKKLHIYASHYNDSIKKAIKNNGVPKKYEDFTNIGRNIVSRIVFNVEHVPKYVFEIFVKANNLRSLMNEDFKIDDKITLKYLNYLTANIKNPKKKSLIDLAVKYIDYCPTADACKDEIVYQIPHWIFPIMGITISGAPRLLLLLANHPKELEKVIQEIKSINVNNALEISKLVYLRKCILETLRLNNNVVTLFRTLLKPYSFGKDALKREYKYDKGTQFIILTNPLLRDTDKFTNPNRFIPSRWDTHLEDSFYAIMFGQGLQKCPGKDLAIFVLQSFIAHYLVAFDFKLKTKKINIKNIEQMINPCKITFE